MTLRTPTTRRTRHLLLAAAIAAGAVVLPSGLAGSAAAAPVAGRGGWHRPVVFIAPLSAPAPQVAPSVVGSDGLAGQAARALDLWSLYTATGNRTLLDDYARMRDDIAAAAAARLSIDPAAMTAAWRAADSTHQLVLLTAFTQLGVPYRAYKRIPGIGFDCSALTGWAWQESGVALPRNSRQQIRATHNVAKGNAQPGDLVWYPGHVMLYLGAGDGIIHAPQRGKRISLATLPKHRTYVKFANPLG